MSDFTFGTTGGLFNQTRASEEVVLIDVGEKSIQPDIVRDGVAVGLFEIDQGVFDDFFGGRPALNQKVVSQSIAPGTPVPEGTAIDLVMAEPGRLPIGVVSGVLVDLVDTSIGDIYGTYVANNPDVLRILARTGDADTLSVGDEARLVELFAAEGVDFTDDPGHDVGAALQTLRVANTFRT